MKKAWWALTLSLLLLLACGSLAESGEAAENWMQFSSRTEPYYTEYRKTLASPLYTGEDLSFPADLSLQTGSREEITVSVPETARYEVWLKYRPETSGALDSELTVSLDGAIPFYELRRIKLRALWQDGGVFPLDRYGNELAPTPTAQPVVLTAGMTDSTGWTDRPFLLELSAGAHTLSLEMQEGAVWLGEISLRAAKDAPRICRRARRGRCPDHHRGGED